MRAGGEQHRAKLRVTRLQNRYYRRCCWRIHQLHEAESPDGPTLLPLPIRKKQIPNERNGTLWENCTYPTVPTPLFPSFFFPPCLEGEIEEVICVKWLEGWVGDNSLSVRAKGWGGSILWRCGWETTPQKEARGGEGRGGEGRGEVEL